MAKLLAAFCCTLSISKVFLSFVDQVTSGIGDSTLQPAGGGATDDQSTGADLATEILEKTRKYDKVDYKTAMRLSLDNAKMRDRFVKINVRGKLVSLPTSSNESSVEELQKILNLDPQYRVVLHASSHLQFSSLMTMLSLPVSYDLVDISNADPNEIARLPLEFLSKEYFQEL